jgi:hypothetical protein
MLLTLNQYVENFEVSLMDIMKVRNSGINLNITTL